MMDCGPKVLGAIMFAEESLGSYAGVKAFQTSDLELIFQNDEIALSYLKNNIVLAIFSLHRNPLLSHVLHVVVRVLSCHHLNLQEQLQSL